MEIIRNLDESGKVINPWNNREWLEMYLHWMRNVEWAYFSISYMLIEIGFFGSHESTNSSESDTDSLTLCSFL